MKKWHYLICGMAGIVTFFCLAAFATPYNDLRNKHWQDISANYNEQEPKMTVEEITTAKKIVIYVTDSAASTAEVTRKFMQIIPVELGGFLKTSGLQMTGGPLAWYNSNQPPFVFDVAAPVNKMPAAVSGRVKAKEIPAGKAVVVHFYGPYELTEKAYPVALAWIKDHHKIAAGAPYEMYIGDPGAEKDPYKVLTDIVFPVQ